MVLLAGSVAASPECQGHRAGNYCVGPNIAPSFPVNHTILRCPEGTLTTCPSGNYCGPPEVTGDALGHSQCHLLHKPSPPIKIIAPADITEGGPDVSLCSPCIQLGSQSINILLNYLLNAGVVSSCGKLCSALKSKGASTVCELACAAVGIKAFIKALNHADLDPILFCEVLRLCKAGPDNASIKVLGAQAQPQSIAKGSTVQLSVGLQVLVPSGVGEFAIGVSGPVTQPVGQSFLLPTGIPANVNELTVQLTPQDDDSGDIPTIWEPGVYNFTIEVCQGECGSKHPHSKVFGKASGKFTLTEDLRVVV